MDEEKVILLVDDQPEHLDLYSLLIESWGYKVITAVDSRLAHHALCSMKIDLLITDVNLPGISGLDLIRSLRQDSQFDNIKIIALTASQSDMEEDLIRSGADFFCMKDQAKTLLEHQMNLLLRKVPKSNS